MRNVALCLAFVLGSMLPVRRAHAQRMPAPVAVSRHDVAQRPPVDDGRAPAVRPVTNDSVEPNTDVFVAGLLTAAILPIIVIGVVAAVLGNANR